MKRRAIITLTVLTAFVLAPSCYDDLSTEASLTLADIIIETEIPDTISYNFKDYIKIDPVVKLSDGSQADFSFKWEMDFNAGSSKNRLELAETKALEMQILSTPASTPYNLTFTATDNATGIAKLHNWTLYVTSSFGEGLLVAYSKDGGSSHELDLVCDSYITYGYTGTSPRYVRGIWKTYVETPLEETVNAMLYVPMTDLAIGSYADDLILVGTDEHFYGLSTASYEILKQDGDFFPLLKPGSYATRYIYTAGGTNLMTNIGGAEYVCNTSISNGLVQMAGPYTKGSLFLPHNVSATRTRDGNACTYAFDAEQGAFYYSPSWMIPSGGMSPIELEGAPFQLSGAKCLGAGPGKTANHFLMRAVNSSCYLVSFEEDRGKVLSVTGPEVSSARSVAFSDKGDVFFYATDKKIYYNVIGGSAVTSKAASWAPDSENEVVTDMFQYSQSAYGVHDYGGLYEYNFYIPTHRTQIVVVTENTETGEGKIYLLPYNAATGRFSAANAVYGGFGKITAICSTPR